MRITNSMTTNRLLLNINRNATSVDRLFMQLSTGMRIQNPSDNPIIASRALRFRTNVADVQQFQRNAAQATSWMEVTESAMRGMIGFMENISPLLNQGATGTLTIQNRRDIATNINMLFRQINSEMNGTFAGRYVFSGFRTNQPPIITQSNPDANFSISKSIGHRDVETGAVRTWRDASGELHLLENLNIVNLPYNNMGQVNIPGFVVNTVSISNAHSNPFDPPPGQINFITETGELVFSTGAMTALQAGNTITTFAQTVPNPPVAPTIDPAVLANMDPNFQLAWQDFQDMNVLHAQRNAEMQGHINQFHADRPDLAHAEARERLEQLLRTGVITQAQFDQLLPEEPVWPQMPTAPAMPDPNGGEDYAQYVTDWLQYNNDMLQQNADFNTFFAQLGPHMNWLNDMLDDLEGGDDFATALGNNGAAPPLSDPSFGGTVPVLQADATVTYTHTITAQQLSQLTELHENFMLAHDAYMHNMDATAQSHNSLLVWNQRTQGGVALQYSLRGINEGELNPLIFFNSVDFNRRDMNGNPLPPLFFPLENQQMRFELGTNVMVPVNVQAQHSYDWRFFADMTVFLGHINRMLLGDAPEEHTTEYAIFKEALYQKFNTMMDRLDTHMQTKTTEFTALGSRMNRVELIQNRLEENEETFTSLMGLNENIDFVEALMRFNAAEAILQAAMQIGARVAQISLVNFI